MLSGGYHLSPFYPFAEAKLFKRPHVFGSMAKIGFLVNPISGMGGRVGLKGTDGVVKEALELGAEPVAQGKALETLEELRKYPEYKSIEWLTCSGAMGGDALAMAGFDKVEIAYEAGATTNRDDTYSAVERFRELGAELVLFCGGDGTARDISEVADAELPMLGIPSGVKMHSGVFGVNPVKTAEVLAGFLEGRLKCTEVEIMDLDEERYRQGEWVVRLYATALTPFEPTIVQASKMMVTEASEDQVKEEIAEYVVEEMGDKPDTLFLLGPGSTVEFVGKELGVDLTLLGIDAVVGKVVIARDLNEAMILLLLDRYDSVQLILSPIGAQGFVLGRGNLQLSPEVIRRIGRENIMVISTPVKMARTPVLRFDTGETDLNVELAGRGYFSVVIGYRTSRLYEVAV
jgi:predicted polyphosphate/ATP-dependent NAD kinase